MKRGFTILFIELFCVQASLFLGALLQEYALFCQIMLLFFLVLTYRRIYLLARRSLKNAQEEEKFHIKEKECFTEFDKYGKKRETLKSKLRNMYRYHGLNREDAVFFNMSDLICNLARTEDCIIVGRCADIILRNNYIPHISLFISAPFEVRLQYMMNVREMDQKTAVKFLKKMDRQHKKYYEFYTSEKWGTPENYDLCINSANYGIKETIEIIERLIINRKKA